MSSQKGLKGYNQKINKLEAELTSIVNEGVHSEDILDVESQIKELVDEDVAKALKNRKKCSKLEDKRPGKAFLNLENAKPGYNEVILLNKDF